MPSSLPQFESPWVWRKPIQCPNSWINVTPRNLDSERAVASSFRRSALMFSTTPSVSNCWSSGNTAYCFLRSVHLLWEPGCYTYPIEFLNTVSNNGIHNPDVKCVRTAKSGCLLIRFVFRAYWSGGWIVSIRRDVEGKAFGGVCGFQNSQLLVP